MGNTTVNLVNDDTAVDTSNDNVVIVDNFASIRGGKSLDVSGYGYPFLHASHPIIRETATDNYKPLPVNGAAIVELGKITAGSGYGNGTYENVALTGGSGSQATATIVVAGGKVTSVTMKTGGKEYLVGENLSAVASTIGGGGTGFAVVVGKISYKPSSYAALPSGHTIEGVLIASILTKRPFAGVMRQGTVNPAAAVIVPTTQQIADLKAALPLIDFRQD